MGSREARRIYRANSREVPRLFVTAAVLDFVCHRARIAEPVETGGILMGPASTTPTSVTVTHASGAGAHALESEGMFLRDIQHCQAVLQTHFETYGVDYVGEWHSHVSGLYAASPGDLITLKGIIDDPDYDFTAFAMLIAVLGKREDGRERNIEIIGYIATRAAIYEVPIEVQEQVEAPANKSGDGDRLEPRPPGEEDTGNR